MQTSSHGAQARTTCAALALAFAITALPGCRDARHRAPAKPRASAATSASAGAAASTAPPVVRSPIKFQKTGFPLTADQLPETTDTIWRNVMDESDELATWEWAAGYCGAGNSVFEHGRTRGDSPAELRGRSALRQALLCGKTLLASAPRPLIEYEFFARGPDGNGDMSVTRFGTALPPVNALTPINDPALSPVPAYCVPPGDEAMVGCSIVVVPNLGGFWLHSIWSYRFMAGELFEKHHVHRPQHDQRAQLLHLMASFGDSFEWVDSGLGKHMSELTWWACGPLRIPWYPQDMRKWVALCGEGERGATSTYRFVGQNASATRHVERSLRSWVVVVRSLCITPKVLPAKGAVAAWERAEYRARWRAAVHAKVSRSGNVVSLELTEKHTAAEKRAMKPYEDWQAAGARAGKRVLDAVAAGRLPAAEDLRTADEPSP